MAREWWRRLPEAQRREYERSASIPRIDLPPDPQLGRHVDALTHSLSAGDRDGTERASQALVDRMSRLLGIPTVVITVLGKRPPDGGGELHGIYRPAEGRERDRITVWMRTAKREDVVAPRTFLRTLLHEVGHHLDMRLLDLPNSFHCKGFYQRESSLFRTVTAGSLLDAKGAAGSPEPATPPPAPDVQRGLALLRAAADDIRSRSRR